MDGWMDGWMDGRTCLKERKLQGVEENCTMKNFILKFFTK
jgi:hypothetical protein